MKWAIILVEVLIDLIFLVCLSFIVKVLNVAVLKLILVFLIYDRSRNC
jgi:hypothetical protein